jgi:hypothetical protein
MSTNFEQLVAAFNIFPFCDNALQQITHILQKQTDQTLPSFVSQTYQSLLLLEHKTWQLLCLDSREWLNHPPYLEFLQTFASFNKTLVFNQDNIEDDVKASLLIPETVEQINTISQRIERSDDDNDLFITLARLWIDNLSFLVHEYPQSGYSPMIVHINQYLVGHFIMTEQFKNYLTQLQQSSPVFTAKLLFYTKTCPFSLNAFFYANPQSFDYTADQVLQNIGDEYLQTVQV